MTTDTRAVLGGLTIEQLDAVVEVIAAAPDGATPDIIAAAVEQSVREAIERRFEVEKLTKAAIEAVFAETNSRPSERIVSIVVASVWDQVHTAQHPDGHSHDGLLPGADAPAADPVEGEHDGTHIQDVTDDEYLATLTARDAATQEPERTLTSEQVRDTAQGYVAALNAAAKSQWTPPAPDSEVSADAPRASSPAFGAHRKPDEPQQLTAERAVENDASTAE